MESRDIEKQYSKEDFVAKIRRLADAIENNENFRISIAGEAVYVPDRATFTIEHERGDGEPERGGDRPEHHPRPAPRSQYQDESGKDHHGQFTGSEFGGGGRRHEEYELEA